MKRWLGAALVTALLVAGCSTSGSQESSDGPTSTPGGPSSSSDSSPTTTAPPLEGATAIEWSDCDGGFQCGTVDVPVDYADPDGPTIEIAVTRHPADDPDQRIGTLFMNPGGPGASAIELAHSFPRAGAISDRFDIVGFDPRGVGESSPLDCHTYLLDMYDADPTIDSKADEAETLRTSQDFVDECEQDYGDLLPFMGTTDVARDMDEVRKAMGEEQINYLGYSYGTSLGQEYAHQFPTKVRSMVLDGVVDHEPDGLTTAESQARGFQTALDSYLANCESEGCGFGSQDAADVIAEVTAAAEEEPIPADDADRPATPGVVSLALAQALYSEQLWGSLSSTLRDTQDGDGTGLVELADMYLGLGADGYSPGGFETYFATGCIDETWPSDPQDVIDASIQAEKDIPYFGGPIVLDYIRCSLRPTASKPLAPVPADTKGLPPIVVVSTTNDPATPYQNGVDVAGQIPGAVLVTNEGEGHGIVAHGKPCIDDMVTDYFVDLTVPDAGLTCE